MVKRFIDTEIWLKNKWFRKLKPKHKLFWFYIISNCDSVGVWEEDIELASYVIQCDYNRKELLNIFSHKIKIFYNNEKWWIKDFVNFQYGILQINKKNKPHSSYIKLLKKHRLYIDYKKTIYRAKEKDKDKDKDRKRDSKERKQKLKVKKKHSKKKLGEYKHVLLTLDQYKNLHKKWGQKKLDYMIKILDEGIELKGYKYKNHNLAIQKWAKKESNIPDHPTTDYEIEDET